MTKVVADISVSLDGFMTGPDADPAHGLGIGGEPLHMWAVASDEDVDAEVLREATEASGAVVTPLFFVVTHSVPDDVRLGCR